MKKVLLIGLAATAMLASCSNDETVEIAQPKAIGFSSFIDKSTRAVDTDLTNLSPIEVYGWRGQTQIFDKQEVTVDNQGKGTYSPLQYWEAYYSYAFEAIKPKTGNKGVTFTANKTGGTINFVNDAQTDLLYAGIVSKTTEQTLATTPGEVSFTFKHLLSRVKFTFKNAFPSNAAAKITVTAVSITNAYKKGSITPTAENAQWTTTDNTLNVNFNSDNVKDLAANTGNAETSHMYLIPNASPSYTVNFTVTLNQNGATTEYEHTATITTAMEKGKSYNFVAEITENNISNNKLFPIYFTANVEKWTDFTNNNITLNQTTANE